MSVNKAIIVGFLQFSLRNIIAFMRIYLIRLSFFSNYNLISMGKMAVRRRKAKKTRKTVSNLMKILDNIKPRVPQTPTGAVFSSIKDYNRKNNKKAVNDGLDG
jgi:hypothetical protein